MTLSNNLVATSHVLDILKSDATQPFAEHEMEKMGDVVSGSVICSNGKLTPNFEYIGPLREANEAKNSMIGGDFTSEKKVLVLGIFFKKKIL